MAKKDIGDRLARLIAKAASPSGAPPGKKKAGRSERGERAESYKFGVITIGDSSQLRCIVLNVSGGGMKIALDSASALPATFHISVPSIGVIGVARLVWQEGATAGIALS